MKKVKKLLSCMIAFSLVLSILVLPPSTAKAASSGIASLNVEYFTHTSASASTSSYGYVSVSLSISIYDRVYGDTGNGTGSSGYSSVGVGLSAGSNGVVTYASSIHSDPDSSKYGFWRPNSGYSFY